jgi:hypothetical protein
MPGFARAAESRVQVDGRWFSNLGDVRVDNSDNNVLETYGSSDRWRTIIRRGFRADKYVATFKSNP